MKSSYPLFATSLLSVLLGCSNPVEEHRLAPEQLAWQGYQNSQLLRFTQRPAGPVRTYRISGIDDRMERQQTGINFTLLPSRKIDCQHLTVTAQRTDTAAAPTTVLDFSLYYQAGSFYSWTTISWDNFYASGMLPLAEINQGVPFDTLQYPGIKQLPTSNFGGVAYGPVIRLVSPYVPPAGATQRTVRVLYYAKEKGVVAFEEAGSLWYRLP